jgi:repressor LexA
MTPMTRRERQVYDFIRSFIAENGFAPTLREIGGIVSLSVPGVFRLVERLREKKLIRRGHGHRSISIVQPTEVVLPEDVFALARDRAIQRSMPVSAYVAKCIMDAER